MHDGPPGSEFNQTAANRFVEQALIHDLLPDLIKVDRMKREQTLGGSRLDFLVNDDTFVEVKTPLDPLQVDLAGHVRTRVRPPLQSTDRLARHITELGASLADHQRAILLVCFLYDNPGFIVQPSRHHTAVHARVVEAVGRGVELWQVNLLLDPAGARVSRYHSLTHEFLA